MKTPLHLRMKSRERSKQSVVRMATAPRNARAGERFVSALVAGSAFVGLRVTRSPSKRCCISRDSILRHPERISRASQRGFYRSPIGVFVCRLCREAWCDRRIGTLRYSRAPTILGAIHQPQ